MSWIKNHVKKPIVFYCIYIFSLIFLVELFSFAILKYKEIPLDGSASRHFYHPYRGHQLNPDYNRKFDTDNKRIHSIDGFRRDMPVSQAKPPNTYRIILMGGSAAYGIGTNLTDTNYPLYPSLKNTETIDYYLQSYLNKNEDIIKSKKKVEVINAAVTAYWTFQHLLYVNESLYKYKPDLIIFLDGHNDFYQHHLFPSTMEDYSFSSPKLITSLNNRSAVFTAYMFTRYFGQYSFSLKK